MLDDDLFMSSFSFGALFILGVGGLRKHLGSRTVDVSFLLSFLVEVALLMRDGGFWEM